MPFSLVSEGVFGSGDGPLVLGSPAVAQGYEVFSLAPWLDQTYLVGADAFADVDDSGGQQGRRVLEELS